MTEPAPSPARPLRIGSRGSPLALVQAEMVRAGLASAFGWDPAALAIVTVTTSGDRIQDRALAEVGGKALWTKELDRALLDGEIDCSVHSMKDVETIRPEAIRIGAMLPRAAIEDRLIGAASIDALPQGARIGTSSPRRAAQLKALRPDIETALLRGNVATRLAKVESGDFDATLLAAAGLDRLGQGDVGASIPIDLMLPAPAQGAVGIECRADDAVMLGRLDAINHPDTYRCVMAERALLLGLGGSCHSPVAAHARCVGADVHLQAQILSADGAEQLRDEMLLPGGDPAAAQALGARMLEQASPAIRALFAP